MSTRVTQATKALLIDPGTTGGAARVTQATKTLLIDPARLGGAARVTQVSLIVIGIRPQGGGGLMLRGVGA